MSKASEELEARRSERANADWERQWWWFDAAHRKHIHEFSAAWEILRRTNAYKAFYNEINRLRRESGSTGSRSLCYLIKTAKFLVKTRNMFPDLKRFEVELPGMVVRWQNMIIDGWTPEKTYLEACEDSKAQCVLSDGKSLHIHIPPTFGVRNRGIPVILPRQVKPQGHTYLFGELCDVCLATGHPTSVEHIAGSNAPTAMLGHMQWAKKPISSEIFGKHIAIQFPLLHPVEPLEALLLTALNGIEESKAWTRQPDCPDRRSRKAHLVTGTLNPFEAIAFFAADEPRNLTEKAFRTLIRPEKLNQIIPQIRKEWIKWESAELRKFDLNLSAEDALKRAHTHWKEAERRVRLAHQSMGRPFDPENDLANLACGDCDQFYRRNRAALPAALPDRLRKDADLNKRIRTGRELIFSQDRLFSPR